MTGKELDGRADRWFDFNNGIYPVKVMMFIGSREEMCDTVMSGLASKENPVCSETAESLARNMRDSFYGKAKAVSGECLSVSADSGFRVWVVRLDEFTGSIDDMVMLSHECLHAALSVLGYCGVQEEPPFEALCYLQEAILKKFAFDAFGLTGLLFKKRESAEAVKNVGTEAANLASLVMDWAEYDAVVATEGWDGSVDEKWDCAKRKMVGAAMRILNKE